MPCFLRLDSWMRARLLARDDADAVVQVFFVRDGKMIGREHFRVSASTADNNYQIIGSFVKQFYAGTPFIPREIWVQEKFPEMDLIAEWLTKRRGQAVKFLIPKKGQKERLVELRRRTRSLCLTRIRIRSREKNSGPSAP